MTAIFALGAVIAAFPADLLACQGACGFGCQVISRIVDTVGRKGCMVLGQRPSGELQMSLGGMTFCVGSVVQGSIRAVSWVA